MEKEIWKDIPQYEGLYQVSSLGRVRSLDRQVKHARGLVYVNRKGKVMVLSVDGRGYMVLTLSKLGKQKMFKVHQLVAMAFLGHVPNGHSLVVDHIDNDKFNNNLNNLQVITQRRNSSKDKKGSSKYTGVSWCKRDVVWRSQIQVGNKKLNLGGFKNEIDAHNAYQKKLKEISK